LQPEVDRSPLPGQPPRPEPVDEAARAVVPSGGLVDPLYRALHACSPPLSRSIARSPRRVTLGLTPVPRRCVPPSPAPGSRSAAGAAQDAVFDASRPAVSCPPLRSIVAAPCT